MKLPIHKGKKIFHQISTLADQLGYRVYAVGGYVRDLYLGREGTDIDFVVVGDALTLAQEFRKHFRSGKVVTYPKFGTAMINYQKYRLEFVTARAEHYEPKSRKPKVIKADLQSDLSRRDFTINTLAMSISPESLGKVTDVYEGKADIDKKVIRTPLEPVVTFSDDPLRILRAIRFAAVLEFDIDPSTLQAMVETRERLEIISQERITEEFRKMLMAAKPSVGFYLMKETGILEIVLPELALLSGVDQRNDFHHKDVFQHTLQVLDNISEKSGKLELRLAALFHDIAKPQTKRFVESTGWTFHGHEDLGERMTEEIGRRLRLPLSAVKYLRKMVRLHLRPMQLVDDNVTDSALRRLLVEAGEEIDDLMALCRADITSKNPFKVKRYLENFDHVENKMKQVEEKDKLKSFQPAIDGNTIMQALQIPPGPLVGKIKKAVTDAVLDGIISNEETACFEYLMRIKHKFMSNN